MTTAMSLTGSLGNSYDEFCLEVRSTSRGMTSVAVAKRLSALAQKYFPSLASGPLQLEGKTGAADIEEYLLCSPIDDANVPFFLVLMKYAGAPISLSSRVNRFRSWMHHQSPETQRALIDKVRTLAENIITTTSPLKLLNRDAYALLKTYAKCPPLKPIVSWSKYPYDFLVAHMGLDFVDEFLNLPGHEEGKETVERSLRILEDHRKALPDDISEEAYLSHPKMQHRLLVLAVHMSGKPTAQIDFKDRASLVRWLRINGTGELGRLLVGLKTAPHEQVLKFLVMVEMQRLGRFTATLSLDVEPPERSGVLRETSSTPPPLRTTPYRHKMSEVPPRSFTH